MQKIVLFDMDGTLTPPREHLDYSLVDTLVKLCKYTDIGIVSGSDYEYIMQQCGFLTTKDEIKQNLHILPCNGTMHYAPPLYREDKCKLIHSNDMRAVLGNSDLNTIFKKIINYQDHIVSHYDIPLTGHFVSYRGSMINWCPIGRNATREDRRLFQEFDKNFGLSSFRRTLLEQIKEEFANAKLEVTIKLGGETSFDIFPNDWDKTYALSHFPDHKIWFLGDRCGDNGNDKEIFDALQPECSYWVDGPSHTKEILEEILIPKLGDL
jgi:phosphomannomutase|tara:strand:+ start:577 stop:1374 length:798 start_codon:yes stop_codon:yes gene_type:complete